MLSKTFISLLKQIEYTTNPTMYIKYYIRYMYFRILEYFILAQQKPDDLL